MYTIIKDNQCGFLLKNGTFKKFLTCGKYFYPKWLGYEIKTDTMSGFVADLEIPFSVLIQNEDFAKRVIYQYIPYNYVAMHMENNTLKGFTRVREFLHWNVFEKNEYKLIDATQPDMSAVLSRSDCHHVPTEYTEKITILPGEVGLLYFDGVFEKELFEGVYYYWAFVKKITCQIYNLKLQTLDIGGQEILTADKIGVRLNIVMNYRIIDARTVFTKLNRLEELLHVTAQLIIREQVGKHRLDELLLQKEDIEKHIYNSMKAKEADLCVKISKVGIKDIILPGEIRDIMNTVLIAEKRAQANVIMRREEIASTRSLLNTAKLMEENSTLYKLKELEYLEKICDKVGNISLTGGDNVIGQLTKLLRTGDQVS